MRSLIRLVVLCTLASSVLLCAQTLTLPVEPPGSAVNAIYMREVAAAGNLTPVKLSFQRIERAMPACDLPQRSFLWWSWADTSKVCVAIWPVDVATNDSVIGVDLALNGVKLALAPGTTYFLERVERGQPIILTGVVPAGYVAAGRSVILGRIADGPGSYLVIWELAK